MNINQEKQLEKRINRLSNPQPKKHFSSTLVLGLLLVGSMSLLAFQSIRTSQPVLSISSDKMNTIYIGIENPMTVAVEGVENKGVKVTSEEVKIELNGYGQYIVRATEEGQARIKVTTRDFEKVMVFDVEKVPSTELVFEQPKRDYYTVKMGVEEFKGLKEFKTKFNKQLGFDCKITEFTLKRYRYEDDIDKSITANHSIIDENPSFVREFMNTAKKGDHFSLRDVKATCPGDDIPREIGGISIEIRNY
jgi:hypothetical protein